MHHPIRTIACCAAAGAALGLAACGGDGGSQKQQAGTDFVARADQVCAAANRTEQAVIREGPGWHYGPKFRDPELMTRFTAPGRRALTRLRALEVPPAKQAQVRRVLSNIDQALGAIEAEIAGVRAGGDAQTSAHTREYEKAYAALAVSAGDAGLAECQGVGF